jgi:diaminopimelate decarboxylase
MTVEFPQHVPSPYYKVDGDCLVVGGRRLTELAAEIGHTPFYVYDRAVMDRRVQELRAALPADLKLHYAIKANPMPAVVAHMARQVDGLDVASGRELEVALATTSLATRSASPGPASPTPNSRRRHGPASS